MSFFSTIQAYRNNSRIMETMHHIFVGRKMKMFTFISYFWCLETSSTLPPSAAQHPTSRFTIRGLFFNSIRWYYSDTIKMIDRVPYYYWLIVDLLSSLKAHFPTNKTVWHRRVAIRQLVLQLKRLNLNKNIINISYKCIFLVWNLHKSPVSVSITSYNSENILFFLLFWVLFANWDYETGS